MTTTNGTRALSACRGARRTLAGSFLNLGAVGQAVAGDGSERLLVVCSGTLDQAAYEDVLGAGALCDLLWPHFQGGAIADSAGMARELFRQAKADLQRAMTASRNARRLLAQPELRDDVPFCLQRDSLQLVAALDADGWVKRE